MESLHLPKDLYWDGKLEPTSPSQDLFSNVDEIINVNNWSEDEHFANEITLITNNYDGNALELKLAEFSDELLNGDDYVVHLNDLREENWNDGKFESVDYPIGTIIPFNPITKVQFPNSFDIATGSNTTSNNFDAHLSNLGSTSFTQLTPPQSPPQNGFGSTALQQITTLITNQLNEQSPQQPQQQSQQLSQTNATTVQSLQFTCNQQTVANANNDNNNNNRNESNNNTNATDFLTDYNMQHDAQLVDEIVETRVKELDWMNDACESETASSYSSPSQSSCITDEEWQPEVGYGDQCLGDASSFSSDSISSSAASSPNRDEQQDQQIICSKKRTRPYGRGVEDRKIRKKEQNKNAATRYRQKKKLEMEIVLTEEQELTKQNDELKRTLAERKREVKYLKTLLHEFCKKKKS